MAVCDLRMSVAEWESLTLEEFGAILKRERERQDARSHELWHMTRLHACLLLQPQCKKTLKPEDLIRLPGDSKRQEAKPKTREERKTAFRSLISKVNKKWLEAQ